MPSNLPVESTPHEITWGKARKVFLGVIGSGSTLVGVFAFLHAFLGRIQIPTFVIFGLSGGLMMIGRPLSFRSRFRLIVAIEAGIAIPLAIGRQIGLVLWEVELITHILLLAVVPIVWFVMDLRSSGNPHPWSPTMSNSGRSPSRSGYRD